jgi:hypothetical protein
MTSHDLPAQVNEILTSATKEYPWVHGMLSGEPGGHLDTAIMLGGLTALCGGILEALALIAENINAD